MKNKESYWKPEWFTSGCVYKYLNITLMYLIHSLMENVHSFMKNLQISLVTDVL